MSELLDKWHPEVPFDAIDHAFRGAYDVTAARALIGFDAEYLLRR